MKIVGLHWKHVRLREMPPLHTLGCVGAPFPSSIPAAARRDALHPKPETLKTPPRVCLPRYRTEPRKAVLCQWKRWVLYFVGVQQLAA